MTRQSILVGRLRKAMRPRSRDGVERQWLRGAENVPGLDGGSKGGKAREGANGSFRLGNGKVGMAAVWWEEARPPPHRQKGEGSPFTRDGARRGRQDGDSTSCTTRRPSVRRTKLATRSDCFSRTREQSLRS